MILRQQQEQARRQQIINQNHGGHSPITGFTTDFENTPHPYKGLDGLKNMLASAAPNAIYEVAQHWEGVYTALDTARQQLQTHTENALQTWEGPAAQQFAARSRQLQESLGNAASYATHTSTVMSNVWSHLQTAKTALDGIHDAGTMDHIGDVLGGESDTQFKADLKSGLDLRTALQLDGSQLNTEEYRFQQAVLVMQQLGSQYNNESAWLSKNRPPGYQGTIGTYPPAPAPAPTPIHTTDPTVAGPGRTGGAGGKVMGADKVNGVNDIGALSPNTGGGAGGAGTVSPVSGGTVSKLPNSPVTSVDGITGGVPVASGASGWGGSAGKVAGLNGLGGAGGGGLGGSGLAGLGLGAAGLGASEGLGGRLAGEGAAGEEGLAAERALAGEEAAARGEGAGANGMMGGMGGLGRGNGRKNKRKQRAAYLVEDEETWEQGLKPNPPVIG
jgi:hypothetical protein